MVQTDGLLACKDNGHSSMNTSVVSKNTTVCVQIVKYTVMKNIVINIFNVVCSVYYAAADRKQPKTPNFK